MSRAVALSAETEQHFNHNEYPLFFTGDLDASFVLVHLNPKQTNNRAERFQGSFPNRSFEAYFDSCRHFGARVYGPASPRKHRSPFDRKQIRFLRPFGEIDFVEERTRADRFINLERVIDRKLQLELVPYGSDSFFDRELSEETLKPHYERLMSVIAARPRDYVIFCGVVFEPLLALVGEVEEEHKFHLKKKDGTLERQQSRFANVRLPYRGKLISAGLAHSWPRMGIPMAAYAEEIHDRYRRGNSSR